MFEVSYISNKISTPAAYLLVSFPGNGNLEWTEKVAMYFCYCLENCEVDLVSRGCQDEYFTRKGKVIYRPGAHDSTDQGFSQAKNTKRDSVV